MKKFITLFLSLSLLTACSGEPPKVSGTFKNVVVEDKKKIEHCMKGCWDEYSIVFKKDDQKVKLSSDDEGLYEALQKGTVVNVSYDSDFEIIHVTFPQMNLKKEK